MSLAQVPEITNPKSQEEYYERILRNWSQRDAQAADVWMNNNKLSENLRTRILRENTDDRRRGR